MMYLIIWELSKNYSFHKIIEIRLYWHTFIPKFLR